MKNPNIVLTNDDGFDSPGLWAAVEKLSDLGEIWITAPAKQYSGAGRCYFRGSDCVIEAREGKVTGPNIHAYAIGCSPAQTIFHAVEEILPVRPDLIISGINYGENVGNVVTYSGTVGAAFEAAGYGIPAIAISQEIPVEEDYLAYSEKIDFTVAADFCRRAVIGILSEGMPAGVDILKIDIPYHADKETPWRLTRLSRHSGMRKVIKRDSMNHPAEVVWLPDHETDHLEPDSDIAALIVSHEISVCPMTIDMSAKVKQEDIEHCIK